jgi:hypothetical protein
LTAGTAADDDLDCRWSGEMEAVLLDQLTHKRLTRPVKLFVFDCMHCCCW